MFDSATPSVMASESSPSANTLFRLAEMLNVVVHLNLPVRLRDTILNSIPLFSTEPTFCNMRETPKVLGTIVFRSISEVIDLYKSSCMNIRLWKRPISIPKFVCLDTSHFKSGLAMFDGAQPFTTEPSTIYDCCDILVS